MGIRRLWNSALNLGTHTATNNTVVRSIQLVNGLASFGLISSWLALIAIASTPLPEALPMNLLSQLATGTVLWLNHRGRYGLAATLLVVFMQLAVLGQAWILGPATGVHFWLLPVVLIPHLLVISPKHNVWLAGHSFISTLVFCAITLWQKQQGQVSADQAFAYVCVIWSLFAMGYYGRKLNDAWATKERKAAEREQENANKARQQSEQLQRTMDSKIETEQRLVEHLFKVSGLNTFSEKLSAVRGESEVMELAAGQAERITGAQRVEVALLVEDGAHFNRFVLNSEGLETLGISPREALPLMDEVATNQTILRANACSESDDPRWKVFADRDLESVVVLPMQAGPSMIGVMTIAARWSDHFERLGYLVAQQFVSVISTHLGLQRALGQLESSLDVSDALLENVLPESVASRMKRGETQIADRIDDAAVFFCDMVGFTSYSSAASAEDVVALLKEVFAIMEHECDVHGVEKIKTIGDAFMAAAGVTVPVADPAHAMASYAFGVAERLKARMTTESTSFNFRMGMHVGPVVAGVIGGHRLFFDLWGDTVNMASRMESNGLPGEISCSQEMYETLSERWHFEERGLVNLKGKGEQMMWLLKGPKEGGTPDDV